MESVNKLIPSFIKTEMCVDVMFDTKQIFSVFGYFSFFQFLPFHPVSSGRNWKK